MQPALDLDAAHEAAHQTAHEAASITERPHAAAPFRLATLDAIESDILGVASAIEALDNGNYGRCALCGAEITAPDLAADPLAVRCTVHR